MKAVRFDSAGWPSGLTWHANKKLKDLIRSGYLFPSLNAFSGFISVCNGFVQMGYASGRPKRRRRNVGSSGRTPIHTGSKLGGKSRTVVVVQFSPAIACNQHDVPLARFAIVVLGLDLSFLRYDDAGLIQIFQAWASDRLVSASPHQLSNRKRPIAHVVNLGD